MGKTNGNNHRKNSHHILPKKLFPELAGDPKNKVPVIMKKHQAYHILYDCDPPKEIVKRIRSLYPWKTALEMINYLNETFWGGLYEVRVNKRKKVIAKPLFRIEKEENNTARIVLKN